ncbi:MAG TPA: type IV toxin-antitoxin system AbiEi family antitoxin domain-containing protein, partial [Solirubrobacterales bacterium]
QDGFSRTRGDDRDIAELARLQHGVVGRGQLVRLGFSEEAIEGRIEAGRLHRLHAGVYAVGHEAIGRESRWLAAVLASGPGAVLSHFSAAALWGVRPTSRTQIDVTTRHRSRSSPVIRRHLAALPDDERTAVDGIPVTTVPRTVFDLAATSSIDVVESAIRQVEYLRLYDRLSLPDLIERYPGRRGVRQLRTALQRIEGAPPGRTRSPLEERFVRFLRRHRLPRPQLNDWIVVGTKRFQVDCHWPRARQVVELDSWEAHGTRSAFREDRARDRALRTAGYAVTRVSSAQLDDEPEAIAADLRAFLAVEYKRM